jgi:type IV secretory pathway VirB2 component (pilin)
MTVAQFWQNLVQLLTSIQVEAAIAAIGIGGLLAACKLIYWHTLFEVLGALVVVFAAANIVNTLYGGG